jgi:hypothetical protein
VGRDHRDESGRDCVVKIAERCVSAANEISDRIEGRPPQHLQISDSAADLQRRSDEELEFFLANSRWPTDEEVLLLRQPVESTEM